MQENLRVNRFTLAETFLKVNVEVSNFYQFMSELIPQFHKFVEFEMVLYIYIYIYVCIYIYIYNIKKILYIYMYIYNNIYVYLYYMYVILILHV